MPNSKQTKAGSGSVGRKRTTAPYPQDGSWAEWGRTTDEDFRRFGGHLYTTSEAEEHGENWDEGT